MGVTRQIKPGTYLQCVCSWCGAKAEFRLSSLSTWKKYACAAHRLALAEFGAAQRVRDDHLTEADHQTWMRL